MTLQRPRVFGPATHPALPALLLHGTGDDEHGLLGLCEALSPSAALLSPRGTVHEAGADRHFRRLRESVFDEEDLRQRAEELAGLVQAATAVYDLQGPLHAVGISNARTWRGACSSRIRRSWPAPSSSPPSRRSRRRQRWTCQGVAS